jgi:hypothetical protein
VLLYRFHAFGEKFRRGTDGQLLEKAESIFGGVFPIWQAGPVINLNLA